MASSNRVQITSVAEDTLGTTPGTPRMRKRRWSGETLKYTPTFDESDEVRDDGTKADPILTGTDNNGPLNFEFHYPFPGSPMDSDIKSALRNTWTSTNSRDNDGTADSVITDVATTNTILTVLTGTGFVAKELYQFSGFTVTGNNGVFKCTTASATVPRFVGSGITDEAAPPAAARVKCVGFIGDSGDINATSTGLSSTTTDFTSFTWLTPGKWIKIDSTTVGMGFVATANNGWARVTAVTTTTVTLDNRPSGWTTETGTALTIRVYCGDGIKNGTTRLGQSIERGFLGQTVPTYVLHKGMVATQFSMQFEAKKKIPGTVTFMGMSGTQGTSTQDASPDATLALSSYPVFACSANVGRIGEAGASVAAPNYVRTFSFNINWNATATDDITQVGPQDINQHEMAITGQFASYFGDNTYLTKFFAGTVSAINLRATKGSQAFIWQFPRVTYNADGSPNASAKNQDVMLPLGWQASRDDALTSAQVMFDRLEYFA